MIVLHCCQRAVDALLIRNPSAVAALFLAITALSARCSTSIAHLQHMHSDRFEVLSVE